MAITGDNGNNVLNGGKGNDLIKGLDGDDVLNGKDGNDTLIGDKGSDHNNGGNGHDRIIWNNGDGSDFNDGGNGNDVQEVNGGNGDEKFTLKAGGQDFLFDRVTAVAFTLERQEHREAGTQRQWRQRQLQGGQPCRDRPEGSLVQRRQGQRSMDAIASEPRSKHGAATATTQLLSGIKADDLYGDNGNDLLVGDKGNDKHFGGAGNDTIVWDNGDGSDTNDGGSGTDTQVVWAPRTRATNSS